MTTRTSSAAIFSKTLDQWLVGGLSIVVLLGFLLFSSSLPAEFVVGNFIVLTVLLNGTHFMASYALLYSSKKFIVRYRWASLYMPLFLIAIGTSGLQLAAPPYNNDIVLKCIIVATSLYLALHYTGQVWGMMASYAYLSGISFTHAERLWLRRTLRVLAGWQMVWALHSFPSYTPEIIAPAVPYLMQAFNVAAVASLLIGGAMLRCVHRRTPQGVPLSVVLPFGALYVWYIFLWIHPQSLFWVQLFHALQYLSFPTRIELNRAAREKHSSFAIDWTSLLKYTSTLAITSTIVFVGIDKGLNYPNGGFETHWLIISSLINIHHFFIDGCIWHISNPEVRADLFAHVSSPTR